MTNLAATCLLALARRIQRGGVIINEHTLSKAQTGFHVRVLSRWFDFITLEDLPSRLARRTGRPFCLLTFDDGKHSNFSETAPELERLHVPAVFYVTTGPVSTGSCFWFDRQEQLVRALGHCPAGLDLETLKQLPFDLLLERLERACAEYGFKPADRSDDLRPMSWEDVRSLDRRGFTIGAHGVSHAILTRETRGRALAEIEESLAKVTFELGAPCHTFAFPNGNYNTQLAQHAARWGAHTIMTTEPMWADSTVSLLQLPRIQLFGSSSRARIESKVALAAFKGALANPDGNGRRYRAVRPSGGTLSGSLPFPRPNR
jgi:peptidoglycan/xylan/chitin deacetylase (PgdA/CDA1 family)